MGLKNDLWIKRMALEQDMISPFVPKLVNVNPEGEHVLSFGLSSYGYDFRLAPEWRIFHNVYMPVVDPKAFDVRSFVTMRGMSFIENRRYSSLRGLRRIFNTNRKT
jgi:dCTP deaminase